MTYSALEYAQTILLENYNLPTDVEQIRTDFDNVPETFECLNINTKEDLEEVIDFMC